jgi:hypothetical protein
MIELNEELINFLDSNDTEDYKKVVTIPPNSNQEEQAILMASSVLGMTRRRELINALITASGHLVDADSVTDAIQAIKKWQDLRK